MINKLLRMFWDVYLIKDIGENKFVKINKDKIEYVDKPEDGTNFILVKFILNPVISYFNKRQNKRYFKVKRMWMPVVRIDASIKPSLYKDIDKNGIQSEENKNTTT